MQKIWNVVKKNYINLIILLVVVLLPLLFNFKQSTMTLFSLAGIYAIAAIGYNLLLGFAGQISLGHAAFIGLGAYITANLMKDFNMNFILAIIIAAAVNGVLGFLVGLPALRLKGHYLAIATLGFGVAVEKIFGAWKIFTGGHSGLRGIPNGSIFGFTLNSKLAKYYFILILLVLGIIAANNLLNTKVGRALRAMSDSESAASSMGINLAKYKTTVFVISAVYASAAGSLMAIYFNRIFHTSFNMALSMNLLAMIVIGGLASIKGSIIGAVYLAIVPELLKKVINIDGAAFIVSGFLMIIIVLFCPRGIIQIENKLKNFMRKRLKRSKSNLEEGM